MDNAARETQVGQQCAELEEACKALIESVSTMEDRLSSVLAQVTPVARESAKEASDLVPHAAFLRARVSSIRDATANLNSLRQRTEL